MAALLPQTISMQRVGGGREFYGSINGNLNYDKADPEVESGIIIIGKITSDFSELHKMDDNITATLSLAN